MDDLRYLHLLPGRPPPGLPPAPFRAVVVIDVPVTAEWRGAVSEWLVRSGCLYMAAWGHECSAWDDSVDCANLQAFGFGDVPADKDVVTTWHDDEPLAEAFWFAANCASHPAVELAQTLIVDISPRDRQEELLNLYRAAASPAA